MMKTTEASGSLTYSVLPPSKVCTWLDDLENFRHENSAPSDVISGKDAPLYAVTNETWTNRLVSTISAENPDVVGNAYLYAGGLSHTRNFVLNDKLEYLFCIDPCLDQVLLLTAFCKALVSSTTPEQAVLFLLENIKTIPFHDPSHQIYDTVFLLYGFFVSDNSPFLVPGGYEKLKQAALENRIQSYCVNVNNPMCASNFNKVLKRHKIQPRIVYMSNLNAKHWSAVINHSHLFKSMNLLASPPERKKVDFLLCSPSELETCSCRRKILQLARVHIFKGVKGNTCEKGRSHMLVFLDRMEQDYIIFILIRFTKVYPYDHDRFMTKIVNPNLRRVSFVSFSKQFRELPHMDPSHREAHQVFKVLYESFLEELKLEQIKVALLLGFFPSQFPKEKDLYMQADPLEKGLVPESIFIIKRAFGILRAYIKNVMK